MRYRLTPDRPRTWESVRTMFTAPGDPRWRGVRKPRKGQTQVLSRVRLHEARQRARGLK